MKKLSLLILFIAIGLNGQENNETIVSPKVLDQHAFKVGEYLKYSLDYGIVSAGYAELNIEKKSKKNGKWTYHMAGFGRTTGITDWAFRTRDYYDTYISETDLLPVEFVRDVDEGGYLINRHVYFNHDNLTAKDSKLSLDSSIAINPGTQDLLSAFYYLRCLDVTDLKKGDKIQLTIFMDHENYPFQLKYLGRETVKIDAGKVKCLKFMPVVQDGRVFRDEESITLWVSDDENKIPVYIKSKLAVGSVKVKLDEYKNLKSPLTFVN